MPLELQILLFLFGYFAVGAAFSGITTRMIRNAGYSDRGNTLLPGQVLLWPVVLPIFILIAIYCKLAGIRFIDRVI